jgi:hypothetical protein
MPREMNIAAPPRWAVHDHGGTGLIKCRLVRAIARCIGGEGNNSTPGEVPYARTHVIMASEPRKWGTYDDGSASLQPSIDRPRATTYLATDELELGYTTSTIGAPLTPCTRPPTATAQCLARPRATALLRHWARSMPSGIDHRPPCFTPNSHGQGNWKRTPASACYIGATGKATVATKARCPRRTSSFQHSPVPVPDGWMRR